VSEIFVAEVGQLTNPSKTALRRAGVAVVEVGDITKCQFMRASEVISGNDLSWAALAALNHDGGYGNTGGVQRRQFVENVAAVVAQNTGRAS